MCLYGRWACIGTRAEPRPTAYKKDQIQLHCKFNDVHLDNHLDDISFQLQFFDGLATHREL